MAKERQTDLVARFARFMPRWLAEIMCALLAAALVVGGRTLIDRVAPGAAPFVLLAPGVLVATLIAGWRAGVLCLLVILYLVWRRLLLPAGFDLAAPGDLTTLLIHAGSAALIIAVVQAFRQSAVRAMTLQAASLDAVVIMDHHGRFLDFNPAAEAMFGYARPEVMGKPVADSIIPERLREPHRLGMARYIATRAGKVVNHRIELPALRKSGEEFPVEIAIVPIDENANPIFVGFIRDITERRRAEERQGLLLNEISHRGKNLLAVMQAIIHRTLKDHAPDEARVIIDQRITALARSQAALVASPKGASLSAIISQEVEGFSNRVDAHGPEIHLKPSAAQTFALIVHELATNATKHGGLANDTGRVTIGWNVRASAKPLFVFEWREHGGLPVTAPIRSGFGRTVLEQIAASEFGARPQIEFASEGLSYRLEAPIEALTEDAFD